MLLWVLQKEDQSAICMATVEWTPGARTGQPGALSSPHTNNYLPKHVLRNRYHLWAGAQLLAMSQ